MKIRFYDKDGNTTYSDDAFEFVRINVEQDDIVWVSDYYKNERYLSRTKISDSAHIEIEVDNSRFTKMAMAIDIFRNKDINKWALENCKCVQDYNNVADENLTDDEFALLKEILK